MKNMITGGRCYEIAALKAIETGLWVVHGIVEHKRAPPHGHAWNENKAGTMVYDYSLGKEHKMPKEIFYALGGVRAVKRYSPEHLRKLLLKYEHYGPFDVGAIGLIDYKLKGIRVYRVWWKYNHNVFVEISIRRKDLAISIGQEEIRKKFGLSIPKSHLKARRVS